MTSQADRRTATRAKLLDSAMATLVEHGHAGFTTTEVGKRAGLSQGALFRHFPTKPDLMAATIEHLFTGLVVGYEAQFATVAGAADQLAAGLDLLADVFADERLLAAYDLFTAARSDPALQASLQPVVAQHLVNLHQLARALYPDLAVGREDEFHATVELVMFALQGMVLNDLAHPDPDARQRLLAQLRRTITASLAAQEA